MTESDPTPYERGAAKLREVYAGDIVELPEGTLAFNDVMMKTLFAEVWDRETLSMRDRRLLIMGVIVANGGVDLWKVQATAALKNSELTPEELRETLIMLAPYSGYPNAAPLVGECEQVINDWEQQQEASRR